MARHGVRKQTGCGSVAIASAARMEPSTRRRVQATEHAVHCTHAHMQNMSFQKCSLYVEAVAQRWSYVVFQLLQDLHDAWCKASGAELLTKRMMMIKMLAAVDSNSHAQCIPHAQAFMHAVTLRTFFRSSSKCPSSVKWSRTSCNSAMLAPSQSVPMVCQQDT